MGYTRCQMLQINWMCIRKIPVNCTVRDRRHIMMWRTASHVHVAQHKQIVLRGTPKIWVYLEPNTKSAHRSKRFLSPGDGHHSYSHEYSCRNAEPCLCDLRARTVFVKSQKPDQKRIHKDRESPHSLPDSSAPTGDSFGLSSLSHTRHNQSALHCTRTSSRYSRIQNIACTILHTRRSSITEATETATSNTQPASCRCYKRRDIISSALPIS